MTWKVEFLPSAKKQLAKLDRQIQIRVSKFLYDRLLPSQEPRLLGKALTGRFSEYWAYRVGDYRILVDIQDHQFTIVMVSIDHRRQVYDG